MSWANNGQPTEWRETADRAYALRAQLGARDSARAIALNALASGDYPAACERYRAMTARDTLDFVAWYGLGDCLRRDRLVVPDSKSPSGFAFRSSYGAAIAAYDRALRIVPSVHLAFAGLGYERLSQLLFTQSTQLRRGFALTPDTVWFAGSATLRGDSVAVIPYRFADISAGRVDTGDASGAIAANRARLLEIARSWKNAYPRSPSAYETLARALESTGNVSGSNDPSLSARAAIDSARVLARDRADSIRTGVVYVRVLLEGSRYAEARAASDAVLALATDPSPREADDVKGLAALTGKTKRAVDLLRRSAEDFTTLTADGRLIKPPLPVAMSARALLGFVVMGGPGRQHHAARGAGGPTRAGQRRAGDARHRAERRARAARAARLPPAAGRDVHAAGDRRGRSVRDAGRARARRQREGARDAARRHRVRREGSARRSLARRPLPVRLARRRDGRQLPAPRRSWTAD